MTSGAVNFPGTPAKYTWTSDGVVRLSTGEVYAIIRDGNGNTGYLYELTSDTVLTQRATWTSTSVSGVASNLYGLITAVDDNDDILVMAIAGAAGAPSDPYFHTRWFDPGTDSWLGSWVAGPASDATYGPVDFWNDISFASDGTAHAFYCSHEKYHGASARNAFHTTWTGSAWGTPEQINVGSGGDWWGNGITGEVVEADDLETLYSLLVAAVSHDLSARRKNGTWGTQVDYTTDTVNASQNRQPIVADSSDNIYRYWVDASYNILENDSDTGLNVSSTPNRLSMAAALYDGVRYIFYINSDGDLVVSENSGSGWGTTVLQSTTVSSVHSLTGCEWQYQHDGRNDTRIYYIFYYVGGSGIGWYDVPQAGGPTPIPDLVSRTRYNRNANLRR